MTFFQDGDSRCDAFCRDEFSTPSKIGCVKDSHRRSESSAFVRYEGVGIFGTQWNECCRRRHLPLDYVDDIEVLGALQDSSRMPMSGLEGCDVTAVKVTNEGIAQLTSLSSLEELNLGVTSVDDVGAGNLSTLTNLKRLSLRRNQITDVGIGTLKTLVDLTGLVLNGVHLHDHGMASIGRQLMNVDVTPKE